MASVLCNQCKSGIHYHGEPSGIKYIFIKDIDWKLIVSTSFDPNNKEYSEPSGSPKLYQTDTIEIDFSKEIHSAWKCPHCDSIMFFDSYGNVTDIFIDDNDASVKDISDSVNYIVFDDYTWDTITEAAIPNSKLPIRFSVPYKATISNNYLQIYSTNGDLIGNYTKQK